MSRKLKKLPPLRTDEEAERFIAESDLTEYDLSKFRRVKFILVPRMTTDAEAEAFLDQDLSDLDFSRFKPLKRTQKHPSTSKRRKR